jgi:hypothetical protein
MCDLVFHRDREPIRQHDLRRSAARDIIRAGVAQTIAMRIAGHKTATMFQRYNICCTEDLRKALVKTAQYRPAGRERVRRITGPRDTMKGAKSA